MRTETKAVKFPEQERTERLERLAPCAVRLNATLFRSRIYDMNLPYSIKSRVIAPLFEAALKEKFKPDGMENRDAKPARICDIRLDVKPGWRVRLSAWTRGMEPAELKLRNICKEDTNRRTRNAIVTMFDFKGGYLSLKAPPESIAKD